MYPLCTSRNNDVISGQVRQHLEVYMGDAERQDVEGVMHQLGVQGCTRKSGAIARFTSVPWHIVIMGAEEGRLSLWLSAARAGYTGAGGDNGI
eukprot:COSAG01_NODE_61551_length_289_cov_0.521053_1_plen_92_part_01